MDGFLSAFADQPSIGTRPMGYYDDRDLPFYWNVADNYVLFDRLFTSASSGSVQNHFFWVTGTPGNPGRRPSLPGGFDHIPTIFDRLQEAGRLLEVLRAELPTRTSRSAPRATVRSPPRSSGFRC